MTNLVKLKDDVIVNTDNIQYTRKDSEYRILTIVFKDRSLVEVGYDSYDEIQRIYKALGVKEC